jgi:hypothetical protein
MKGDGNPLALTALVGRGRGLIPRLFSVNRTRLPAVGRRMSTAPSARQLVCVRTSYFALQDGLEAPLQILLL